MHSDSGTHASAAAACAAHTGRPRSRCQRHAPCTGRACQRADAHGSEQDRDGDSSRVPARPSLRGPQAALAAVPVLRTRRGRTWNAGPGIRIRSESASASASGCCRIQNRGVRIEVTVPARPRPARPLGFDQLDLVASGPRGTAIHCNPRGSLSLLYTGLPDSDTGTRTNPRRGRSVGLYEMSCVQYLSSLHRELCG
jgi:hypothetical protein